MASVVEFIECTKRGDKWSCHQTDEVQKFFHQLIVKMRREKKFNLLHRGYFKFLVSYDCKKKFEIKLPILGNIKNVYKNLFYINSKDKSNFKTVK